MHEHNYTKKSLTFSKKLRSEMTPFEEKLWFYLRGHRLNGLKFKRQAPVGNYIVDFVCKSKNLIIELDGSGHLDMEQILHDEIRDKYLTKLGYKIIRIYNNEIENNIGGVLEYILMNTL